MPNFDGRYKELMKRLDEARPKLKAEEITRIDAAIRAVDQARHAALADVSTRIGDGGDSEQAGPCKNALANAWSAIDPPMENMLGGVTEPSEAATGFRNRMIIEELRFWTMLQGLDLGGAHDEIKKRAANLEAEMDVLRTKWDAIEGPDKDILDAEVAATRKAVEILKKGSEAAASTKAEALRLLAEANELVRSVAKRVNAEAKMALTACGVPEGAADFLTTMGKPGKQVIDINEDNNGIPAGDTAKGLVFHVGDESFRIMDPGAWTADALKMAVKAAGVRMHLDPEMVSAVTFALGRLSDALKDASIYLQGPYCDQVRSVRGMFPSQDSLLVVFSQTRKEADDFIRNKDNELANERYNKVCADLDRLHSDAPSEGFKADIDEFGEIVVKGLHERVSEVDENYHSFVNWNSGKFIGDHVSPELKEKLLGSGTFDELRYGIKSMSLPESLKWWRDGVTALTPQVGGAFTAFNDVIDQLPFEVGGQIQSELNDWQDRIQAQLRQIADNARTASDACVQIIGNDQVDKDFDRRALEARVP
jgi:hypothetical protein